MIRAVMRTAKQILPIRNRLRGSHSSFSKSTPNGAQTIGVIHAAGFAACLCPVAKDEIKPSWIQF